MCWRFLLFKILYLTKMKKRLLLITISIATQLCLAQSQQSRCDTISKSILFDSGDYSINTLADSFLQTVILDLQNNNISSIELIGHTDPRGSVEYNQRLSKNRVETVENYVLDYVDLAVSTDFYGKSQLLKNDTTKVSDSLNRRVEIIYYINCTSTNPVTTNSNIIYQYDSNCHIDTSTTREHYDSNLKGENNTSVVVLDWTRSMYAYGFELLDWFKQHKSESSFKNVVMFNDGDGKPTSKKPLGKAGGIYTSNMDSLNAVIDLMETVANNGTGGDYPENYIEALIYAQNKHPNVDTLILIADNRACIRDYKLMEQLSKPIIVILNEINPNNNIINYQYVNLIAQTGGRLVFMNEALKNINFKNNQGYKPIYFKDTLIVLPKFRGDIDHAYEQIALMKAKQLKTSVPSILMVDSLEYERCMNKNIPNTIYKIGCATCRVYDYNIKTHTTFKAKFTLRQKIAIKWRKRLRAKFGVIDYKWRKIKCEKCKNIKNRDFNLTFLLP